MQDLQVKQERRVIQEKTAHQALQVNMFARAQQLEVLGIISYESEYPGYYTGSRGEKGEKGDRGQKGSRGLCIYVHVSKAIARRQPPPLDLSQY